MIRTTRIYIAKPGLARRLIENLKDFQSFGQSEGMQIKMFTEPWGNLSAVHYHTDHSDAGAAQEWWEHLQSIQRSQSNVVQMEDLIEGHRQASILLEEG